MVRTMCVLLTFALLAGVAIAGQPGIRPGVKLRPAGAAQPVTDSRTVTPPSQAPASPQAGETVDWYVLAGGGGDNSSATYAVSGTLGQPIVGGISSATYAVNQGYWQATSTSCCKGVVGNIDGDPLEKVNLIDLADLINFLTAGPFVPPCPDELDLNQDHKYTIVDLASLINYMTAGPFVLPPCP